MWNTTAFIKNHWNSYDSDIFKYSLEYYLERIFEIGTRHNSGNVYVWQNGDAISGNIHKAIALTNKEDVIEQITQVSELIANFLANLAGRFNNVYYMDVSGNHSRIDKKDEALRTERLDDLINWYLKVRLKDIKNVHMDFAQRIDATIYSARIRGKQFVGVHGDFDGTNDKIAALTSMIGEVPYAILCGHKHHNMIDTRNGVKLIMAGSFMGMDDFCIERRIVGKPEQLVCVCSDAGINCYYNIEFSD